MSAMERATEFADGRANTALRSAAEVNAALGLAAELGLPLHPDRPKNWDNLIAVVQAAAHPAAGLFLDAGGSKDSAFLPGLASLGYENLLAINTEFRYPEWSGGVEYRPGDATATGLPDGCVDFFACLSVVEHGVDEGALVAEAARVLRPGGMLMVSTDYWPEKVDARGQTAFGHPIKVSDAGELQALIGKARMAGLRPAKRAEPDFSCEERVVNWMGMDYTFCNVLLAKS